MAPEGIQMNFDKFRKSVREKIRVALPDQTIHLRRRFGGEIEVLIGYISPEHARPGERISRNCFSVEEFREKDSLHLVEEMEEKFAVMLDEVTVSEHGYRLDDLLGASDVAELLGWDIRKVSAYAGASKAGFPRPIGTIGKRPVWYRVDIEQYRDRDKIIFAEMLGFNDWNELMVASEHVVSEGDIDWWITRLPDGRWAAWDDAEISEDRVEYFDTREEAIRFHRGGFEAAELPSECWLLD